MHMVIKILLIKLDDAWIEMQRLSVSFCAKNFMCDCVYAYEKL